MLPANKRVYFWLLLVLFSYGLTELACWLALLCLRQIHVHYTPLSTSSLPKGDRKVIEEYMEAERGARASYLKHDAELGWTLRPGGRSDNGLYRANTQGLRAEREYAKNPPPGRRRLCAFGDSFTHADDVAFADTWPALLEKLDPKFEVLNFGVCGFGPDQAFLRYLREEDRFRCDVVLIGYMSENINRTVNVFRAFYGPEGGLPLAKPRFVLEGSSLKLLPNPLPSIEDYATLLREPEKVMPTLARRDYWYDLYPHRSPWDASPLVRLVKLSGFWYRRALSPRSLIRHDGVYRQGTEALEVTKALLARFYEQACADGSEALVVLFPSHRDILRHRRFGRKRYGPLIEFLGNRGIAYLDLLEGFRASQGRYQEGGVLKHYSPSENQVVAETLLRRLRERPGRSREIH